jgi:hypothetical protein
MADRQKEAQKLVGLEFVEFVGAGGSCKIWNRCPVLQAPGSNWTVSLDDDLNLTVQI